MNEDLRISKGMETKERILDSSMKIMAEEGLVGLSAKKIADRSQVSKSNIFHHFGSVDGILDAIFKRILADFLQPIQEQQAENAEQFFLFFGENVYGLIEEKRLMYLVLFHFYNACLHHDTYREFLFKVKKEGVNAIASQLSQYSSQNEARLLTVAEMMLMTLDGYGLHYLLHSDPVKFKEMWMLQVKLWLSLIE